MSTSSPQSPQPAGNPYGPLLSVLAGTALLVSSLWFGGMLPGSKSISSEGTIPGLSANELVTNLEERGFNVAKDTGSNKAICTRERYNIEITGLRGGVSQVTVSIAPEESTDSEPKFAFDDRKLMGYVASMPYDGADTNENTHWAELHFEMPDKRTNGKAVLETKSEGDKRILIIRAIDKSDLAAKS